MRRHEVIVRCRNLDAHRSAPEDGGIRVASVRHIPSRGRGCSHLPEVSMSRLVLLALAFLAPLAAHAADDSRAARLAALYAEYWEENLRLNPITATQAGDPRYNAELPNLFSIEHREA